jgi:hypothetical protein
MYNLCLSPSVADTSPSPCLQIRMVFGPRGSGSISTMYGAGYGSFYNQAKIVKKTLIPIFVLLLYDFLSLKNCITNVASKSKMKKKLEKK